MSRIALTLAVGLLFGGAAPGYAATHIASTSNNTANTYSDADGDQFLELDGDGATTFTITVYEPSRLAIFFNATCTVAGANDTTWLDIDIVVNGVDGAPSNGDDAFCTSDSDGTLDGLASMSRDVVVDVPAGDHDIQIRGGLPGGAPGDEWSVDDLSLIVVSDGN